MKKVLLLSVALILLFSSLKAQYVYKIKADSVKITNDSCTAELIIENTTKGISGFLYNKGNGRTEFRRVIKLGDTAIVIGVDTIKSLGGSGSAWLLAGNNGVNSSNFLGTINNYRLPIRTNNIERMVIDSIGRVGIGTNNPNTRLEVNALKGDYSPYIPQIWSNAAARINNGNLSIFSTGDTSVAGDSYQMDFYSRYYNTGQGYVTNKTGYIKGRTINNPYIYPPQSAGQGILILGSTNTNYNNTTVLDTPAVYITNGAVGIRTNSPQVTLHVADTSGGVLIDPRLSRNTDRIRIGNYNNKYDGQNILLSTSSDNGLTFKNIVTERDGNVAIGTNNPTNMSWVMGATGSLRVHADGRVGIAHNYFHFGHYGGPFNSSALVTSVSNTNEWNDYTNYPNGQNYYYFGTVLGSPYNGAIRAPLKISGNELHFLTAAVDSEAVRITKLGNVLIGTTIDSFYRLDVKGTARISNLPFYAGRDTVLTYDPVTKQIKATRINGGGAMGWSLSGNAGNISTNFLGTLDNMPINFATNNINRGSVSGVGNWFFTSPDSTNTGFLVNNAYSSFVSNRPASNNTAATLMIAADYSAESYGQLMLTNSTNVKRFKLGYNSTSDYAFINATDAVSGNGKPIVIQNNNGNLLIGTTTDPGFKLNVNGTARISTLPFVANRDTVLTYDPTTNQVKATKIPATILLGGSDQSNTTTTMANVTGLSFNVTANTTYRFKFFIVYTAAATATGSRWSVNGPSIAGGFLHYTSEYSLTTTTKTTNQGLNAYDLPATANNTSASTGSNIAVIEGVIKPTANGTVSARFASKTAGSAITAKTGMCYVTYEVLQ